MKPFYDRSVPATMASFLRRSNGYRLEPFASQ